MASALSRMMKKAAGASSLIIPVANRTTLLRRKYTTAILDNPLKTSCTNLFRSVSIQTHRFSALAETDDTLLSFVESQIDSTEKKFRKLTEAPRGFPFKIVDNPEEKFITLTREYQGEEIKVKVNQPHDYIYYEKTRKVEVREEVQDGQKGVHFTVRVSNKSGLTLVFCANANATTDGLKIYYLFVENSACDKEPNFSNLNENVRKALHNYLEVRGLEPSNTKFLWDYMVIHRKHMKCTTLLHDLKTFIAE